jgi:hypothetical protein
MPDTRNHRGAHPEDAALFAPAVRPQLRSAASDLYWALDRGYAMRSAIAFIGDRHDLTQRQRIALTRCACSAQQRTRRRTRESAATAMRGATLWVDGYNVLITVEAALAGAVVLLGRDGCFRDLASQHGTYRQVEETKRAIQLIGVATMRAGIERCRWVLDRPVSNSGRLKTLLHEIASDAGWRWEVDLEFNPDHILTDCGEIVASADSAVLDRCGHWFNLARGVVADAVPGANVVDLAID